MEKEHISEENTTPITGITFNEKGGVDYDGENVTINHFVSRLSEQYTQNNDQSTSNENLKIECTRMILNLIHELLHTKQLLTNSPSSKEFLTSIANYYSEEFIEKATPDVNKVFRAVTSLKECPIIIESKGNQSKLKPGSGNQQELTEESNAMLAEARINRLAPILRTTIEYPENPILNTENFAVGIQKRSTTIECDEEKFREKMGEKSLTHWPQGSDSFVETKEYDILLKLNNQIDPIIEEAFNEFAAQIFNAQE